MTERKDETMRNDNATNGKLPLILQVRLELAGISMSQVRAFMKHHGISAVASAARLLEKAAEAEAPSGRAGKSLIAYRQRIANRTK